MNVLKIRKDANSPWQDIIALRGEQGLPGEKGADGAQGLPGKDGKPGPAGSTGPAGKNATINGVNALEIVQGENINLNQSGNTITISAVGGGGTVPGENGATFIPAVSVDGEISWTNDKGLDNPTPVNIKGNKGANGKRGPQGEPATINGVNALEIVQGENINLNQSGNQLTISATGFATQQYVDDAIKAITNYNEVKF